MPRLRSTGTCLGCRQRFAREAIEDHLAACPRRKAGTAPLLHVAVEGRQAPEYWMRLAADPSATLEKLDAFLRKTWLECCGHMSSFTIDGTTYTSGPPDELGDECMRVAMRGVLKPGLRFTHAYDFGSTTELALRVVAQAEGKAGPRAVRLLARNDPPPIVCEHCDSPAARICADCGKCLCPFCAGDHACGEEMLLPLVNSPRAGVCGYTG